MTYTWNNKTVDVYPTKEGHTDVIFNVHWRLTGENENGVSAGVYGTISLNTDDLSNFTDFASVTEADVDAWVEASMGEEELASLKEGIAKQIEEKENPSVVTMQIGGSVEA